MPSSISIIRTPVRVRRSGRSAGREMRVDELDRHCSFAYGGGTSLGRACADIAGGEDAGDAGLEQVVGPRGWAGQNKAFLVALDGIVEPLGAGQRPEEQEQEREREPFTGGERDRFDLSLGPV